MYGAADQNEILRWESSLNSLATEDVLIYRNMEGCKSAEWSLREERKETREIVKEREWTAGLLHVLCLPSAFNLRVCPI